jgi:hypothetical protein
MTATAQQRSSKPSCEKMRKKRKHSCSFLPAPSTPETGVPRRRRAPRTLIKPYVPVFTADDAVKEMGGNVSPGVRRALDALYGTESDKKIASLIDGMNEVIKSQNRLQKEFDEQDEQLAEIKKANQRQNRQLDELLEGEKDIRERLDRLKQSPYL